MGRRVCETHADEGPEECEGPLAPRVGGVDVKPPIAEANLDSGIVRTLIGGTDRDESLILWQRPRERLGNSGLEVERGDVDAGAEHSEDIVGRSGLKVNCRDGTADRRAKR